MDIRISTRRLFGAQERQDESLNETVAAAADTNGEKLADYKDDYEEKSGRPANRLDIGW